MLISSLLLIFSNLVPLIGAVFFRWDISSIIFLYWLESSVIGLSNVAKMITIIHYSPYQRFTFNPNLQLMLPTLPFVYGLIPIPFFLFHFGGFMLVHGIFLAILGLVKLTGPEAVFGIMIAYLSMIISHGVSFYTNFISKKEFLRTSLAQQMFQPYGRVMVMHFTIFLIGAFLFINNSSIAQIILLVVMKTIVDLLSHLKEHSGLSLVKPMTPQQLGQTIVQMKADGKTIEEITEHLMNNTVK